MMDRPPWESTQPRTGPPPMPQGQMGQMADLERMVSLAEGLMDRVWPKMQKFLEGVQAAKSGRPLPQLQDARAGGNYESQPLPPMGIEQPQVTAESVYGMIFDMLNMVPDDMTCGEMRTHVRDNKEIILTALRDKLGA